jgi:hypothetical protein
VSRGRSEPGLNQQGENPRNAGKIRLLVSIATLFFQLLTLSSIALAGDDSFDGAEITTGTKFPRGRIELKRQNTNRGTAEETTKTQLKIDACLDGFVSLLRLEAPFPDEKTDFEGNPFNPHLGDIKARVGFHPFPVEDIPVFTFVEVTFPTASPEDFGSGKYQLTGGIQPNFRIPLSDALSQSNAMIFSPLVKQVVSVGGDENRKNINYTQFELALRDVWEKKYWLKLTPKPVIDWEQDGKTGAVLELEIGWIINRNWSTWLMLGTRLWGEGVPNAYDQRVELGVAFLF